MSQTQHSILVVEDETSIATFVAAYLRNAGYGVRTASNAQTALVELATEPAELLEGSAANLPVPIVHAA